ncbi:putative fatty-acid--CoA ligase fadD21 [Enhygromyxa salina]|uniref:Putative fatty-acid--CoA ligase fadD21 n=1 Tax=Enhygromyxa salina TaxID=215803 RepID=A0A2S9XSL3_9BACT|nr:thioester reductase domain-containing protein [Enhygromyxa salina]PRP95857.1 putative fatty-acid--CoA ligase fadD21 [Enhygromyxa salina]
MLTYEPAHTHPGPFPPIGAPTVLHALLAHAREQPDRTALTWLDGDEGDGRRITFADLADVALRLGGHLRALGLRGERVLLQYADGFDFLQAFLGCVAGGVVPVPATTLDPSRPERTLPRLTAIAGDCGAAAMLIGPQLHRALETALDPAIQMLELSDAQGAAPCTELPSPDDLALVQYTSGSTGVPKGVRVTHRQLEHTVRDTAWSVGMGPDSSQVTWLPHYHDMGLIYALLGGIFLGFSTWGMTPAAFIERPVRWLRAIDRVRATHTAAPNFAYELVLRRYDPARDGQFDLSCLRSAMNAAEPVREATLQRFLAVFGEQGLRPEALMPSFGMAEASVKLSVHFWGRPPRVERFDAAALREGRVVVAPDGVPIVALGQPGPGSRMYIVDPETRVPCSPGRVGELWYEGPAVADGYWNRPDATLETFGARTTDGAGPMLRTGDLGFFHGDDLFFAGRVKDLIIIRGQNHHPHDLEATVQDAHPTVRPGSVAAFSIDGPDTELLVIVAEVDPSRGDVAGLRPAVREAIALRHDVLVHAFVAIAARTMPKTSSGKIRRAEARRLFLAEKLSVLETSAAGMVGMVAPERAASEIANSSTPDREGSGAQQGLFGAFAELIGRLLEKPPPGPDDDLLALGLDSLTLVELTAALKKTYGFTPPARELLAQPSVRALVTQYERWRRLQAGSSDAPAEPSRPADPGFAQLQRGIRTGDDARRSRRLPGPLPTRSQLAVWRGRIAPGTISLDQLGGLLATLRQAVQGGAPAYRTPDVEGLHAVQAYCRAEPKGVEGLEPGTYYHHPVYHSLLELTPEAALDAAERDAFGSGEPGACTLVLAAEREAIAPIFGASGDRLATLQAGALLQALGVAAAEHGLQLTLLPRADLGRCARALALSPTTVPLTAVRCGRAQGAQAKPGEPAPDASEEPVEPPGRLYERLVFGGDTGAVRIEPSRLIADARLPDDIRPLPTPVQDAAIACPEQVFLTGATGFLGAFLLRAFRHHTRARLALLVRAPDGDPAAGRERIKQNLLRYRLPAEELLDGVEVIPGDLTRPSMGLDEATWRGLAERTDAVVHAAAPVSWVLPYDRLVPAVVDGTRDVLRFAAAGRPKVVHHISSLGALAQIEGYGGFDGGPVHEHSREVIDAPYLRRRGFQLGYIQAKWVADQLVQAAQARGLPVVVYRMPYIAGASDTGAWSASDIIAASIAGCVQLGWAPDVEVVLDMVPVDYVAEVIADLARQPRAVGRSFHLANPEPIPWPEVVARLIARGHPITLEPAERWLERVRSSSVEPLVAMRPCYESFPLDRIVGGYPAWTKTPRLLAERTTGAFLRSPEIRCARAADLFDLWLDWLQQTGKLPVLPKGNPS